MPLFVVRCTDKPDSADLRAANRPAHLDYLRGLGGAIKAAGPFVADDGKVLGSMIILEADDRAAAEACGAADPYAQAGVFAAVEVTGWRWVLPELP